MVSKVGYTFLYDAMVESNAIFGAETSGHIYFRVSDKFYTESAAYALVILLKLLQERKATLSELVAPLEKRYVQSPEINVEIEDKDAVMERVESHFAGAKIDKTDGISIAFEDYWFNIRTSNTEPKLRLNLEANTKAMMERMVRELTKIISPPQKPSPRKAVRSPKRK